MSYRSLQYFIGFLSLSGPAINIALLTLELFKVTAMHLVEGVHLFFQITECPSLVADTIQNTMLQNLELLAKEFVNLHLLLICGNNGDCHQGLYLLKYIQKQLAQLIFEKCPLVCFFWQPLIWRDSKWVSFLSFPKKQNQRSRTNTRMLTPLQTGNEIFL